MNKLKYIIIHCTDTPKHRAVTRKDLEKWHLKERGWSRLGYSDMIHQDGSLENLIPWNTDSITDHWEISNGARGMNAISRHIVYVGGKGNDSINFHQEQTLNTYLKFQILINPSVKIIGHNQVSQKKCPNFSVTDFCKSIGIPSKNIGL